MTLTKREIDYIFVNKKVYYVIFVICLLLVLYIYFIEEYY